MPVNPLGSGPDPEIRLREPPKADEEGDPCPHCDGVLVVAPLGECACHIIAPCINCESAPLACTNCGWSPTYDDDQF